MRTTNVYWLIAIVALVSLSCNKNTNQLPPVSAPPGIYTKTSTLDGVAILDVFFAQTRTPNSDTIWAWVKNLRSETLLNARILIEICDSAESFDNCGLQQVITIDSLPGNDTAGYRLLYVNKSINFVKATINTGILSYEGMRHVLGNTYGSVYATFYGESDTAFGKVRGYVLADGNSTFRFRLNDTAQYNARGVFTQDFNYQGQLLENDDIVVPLALDSIAASDSTMTLFKREGDELNFMFRSSGGDIDNTYTSIFIKVKTGK